MISKLFLNNTVKARDQCRQLGGETGEKWDLIIFNNQEEFNMLNNYLIGSCLR